jgi:DDE superfamily endonuclease/Helix-turn-helix of DDE superfamily endonuclease
MINYKKLLNQPRRLLALTSLTTVEFQDLLSAFGTAYAKVYPIDRTLDGQPRQRWPGGGRRGALAGIEDKLLFVLVYLKTYPLQVVLGELFGIGTSQANYWLYRLLPALRLALDQLHVLPERDGHQLVTTVGGSKRAKVLIIDGTERRRQRPKKPEKQALYYSGKKKAHTDKNVLVVSAPSKRVLFLSGTYAGKVHDKKIADQEQLVYPRDAILYKDAGFQGYEPPVDKTCQAKKKATGARANRTRERHQSQVVENPRACRTRACGS